MERQFESFAGRVEIARRPDRCLARSSGNGGVFSMTKLLIYCAVTGFAGFFALSAFAADSTRSGRTDAAGATPRNRASSIVNPVGAMPRNPASVISNPAGTVPGTPAPTVVNPLGTMPRTPASTLASPQGAMLSNPASNVIDPAGKTPSNAGSSAGNPQGAAPSNPASTVVNPRRAGFGGKRSGPRNQALQHRFDSKHRSDLQRE